MNIQADNDWEKGDREASEKKFKIARILNLLSLILTFIAMFAFVVTITVYFTVTGSTYDNENNFGN